MEVDDLDTENFDLMNDELIPMYDTFDLAMEISNMGALAECFPTISQSLGENEDLFLVQKKKNAAKLSSSHSSSLPTMKNSSPDKKKKGHRRSTSDPDALRHQIFESVGDLTFSRNEETKCPTAMDTDSYEVAEMDISSTEELKASSPNNMYFLKLHEDNIGNGYIRKLRAGSVASSSSVSNSRTKNYNCSKCGMIKKGHICPLASTISVKMVNQSTQHDLNTTQVENILLVSKRPLTL